MLYHGELDGATLSEVLGEMIKPESTRGSLCTVLAHNTKISDDTLAEVILNNIRNISTDYIALILENRPKLNTIFGECFIEEYCRQNNSSYWKNRLLGSPISLDEILVHMQGYHPANHYSVFNKYNNGVKTRNFFIHNDDDVSYLKNYQGSQINLNAWFIQKVLASGMNTPTLSSRLQQKLEDAKLTILPQPTPCIPDLIEKWKESLGDGTKSFTIANGKWLSLNSYFNRIKKDDPDKFKKICLADSFESLEIALSQHRNLFFKAFGKAMGKKTDGELIYEEIIRQKISSSNIEETCKP